MTWIGLRMFLVAGASLLAFPTTGALAQTTVEGSMGLVFKYRGDTIWRFRDTSLTRTVFHGDTIKRATYIESRLLSSVTYVLQADSVRIVTRIDGDGKEYPAPTGRLSPARMLFTERDMVESAIQMRDRRAGMSLNLPTAPVRPATPQTYAFSERITIVHHLDTVRYITGCSAFPPIDTTTYLFVGGDSLRRLSPNGRVFGPYMALAVRGDMDRVGLMSRSRARMPAVPDLPGKVLPTCAGN